MSDSAPVKSSKAVTTANVLSVFEGTIKPPRTSIFYLLGMAVVTLAMVLLPLIYLSIIAGVGWLTYYHAVNDTWILTEGVSNTRASRGRALGYFAPIVAGLVVIFVMLKPLIARPRRESLGVVIEEAHEPVLIAFVKKLCESMGAPVPREIRVDCDVNASASFHKGFWGLLTNRLTLTIGLPLVTSLTLKQLSGIMAHEFGHFTQFIAMRLSYVIRSINHWFARVVYERDNWDEYLSSNAESSGWMALPFLLARLCVFIARQILKLLMYIGCGLSSFMSRQMEYDADKCEAYLAGSDCFAQTMYGMNELGLVNAMTVDQLQSMWNGRRLVDDLPALIERNRESIPDEARMKIRESVEKRKAGLFDTHPADSDRMRVVKKLEATGIMSGDAPASVLFKNLPVISKVATLMHYREEIGLGVGKENLISTDDVTREQTQAKAEAISVQEYLGHRLDAKRPVFLESFHFERPADPKATVERLRRLREAMAHAQGKVIQTYEKLASSTRDLGQWHVAGELLRQKIKLNPKDWDVANFKTETMAAYQREKLDIQNAAIDVLAKYEVVLRERVSLGLQLLRLEPVRRKINYDDSVLDEVKTMLGLLSRLAMAYEHVEDLRREEAVGSAAIGYLVEVDEAHKGAHEKAMQADRRIREVLRDVRESLGDVRYPFEHGDGEVLLATYLIGEMPERDNAVAAVLAAQSLLQKLERLYLRAMSKLIRHAQAVEKGLGVAKPQAQSNAA